MMFSSRMNDYLRRHGEHFPPHMLARALRIPVDEVSRRLSALGLRPAPKGYAKEGDVSLPPYVGEAALPSGVVPLSRLDWLCASGASLAALIVYMFTLAPTVSGEDSGELVTAAYTLGVAHPPGYPLWCLLGKVFTYIPSGTIAGRVNFMSSFFSALSVFVVYLILMKLTRSRLGAIAGALVMAFSAEFWEQAVIAEVYGLNSFLVVLAIYWLLAWYERRRPWTLLAFAVTFGLGLCNHNTMALLGPVFLGFVLFIDPYFMHRKALYIQCVVAAVACLGIYLYLPIRSLSDPPVDWGNPETWEGMLAHITREQYAFALKENPRSIGRLLTQCGAFLKLYLWEFGPWLAWLPIVGAITLWRRERVTAVFLFIVALVTCFGVILATNFEIDRQSLWLNNVFWIPCYVVAAIGVGASVEWMLRYRPTRLPTRIWSVLVLGIVIGSPLALNFTKNDKSDYYFASSFGKNTLLSLGENAIYFPTADHATFPVLYFQACEGMRPDVTIANKYGYPEESLYADMPESIRNTFGAIPNSAQEKVIEKWIIEQNPERPVYFTQKRDMRDLPDYEMREHGIVFALAKRGAPPEPLPWDKYRWHVLTPEKTRGELTADSILSDAYYMRGRAWLVEGNQEDALGAFRIAAKLGPESKETLNNLGSACAEFGLPDEAIKYYEQCIAAAPDYAMVRKNLAQVLLSRNDVKRSLLHFEEYLKHEPNDIQALKTSATCMEQLGWYREAITRLEYLVSISPNDAEAYRTIGRYYEEGRISARQAHAYYARSLEIDPSQQDLLAKLNPSVPGADIPDPSAISPSAGLPQIPGIELPSIPQVPSPVVPGQGPGIPQLPGGL